MPDQSKNRFVIDEIDEYIIEEMGKFNIMYDGTRGHLEEKNAYYRSLTKRVNQRFFKEGETGLHEIRIKDRWKKIRDNYRKYAQKKDECKTLSENELYLYNLCSYFRKEEETPSEDHSDNSDTESKVRVNPTRSTRKSWKCFSDIEDDESRIKSQPTTQNPIDLNQFEPGLSQGATADNLYNLPLRFPSNLSSPGRQSLFSTHYNFGLGEENNQVPDGTLDEDIIRDMNLIGVSNDNNRPSDVSNFQKPDDNPRSQGPPSPKRPRRDGLQMNRRDNLINNDVSSFENNGPVQSFYGELRSIEQLAVLKAKANIICAHLEKLKHNSQTLVLIALSELCTRYKNDSRLSNS